MNNHKGSNFLNSLKIKIINNKKVIENYFFMTVLQILNSLFYLIIYPFLIRTNETSTLKEFKNIANSFGYQKTKDSMVINCINLENCTNISNALIKNNITNLDLGLFQINYNNFKYPLYTYFDKQKSYLNACEIVEEKIKMNKGKWNWEVLASYHSMTPKYNNIYKKKLINNYRKLLTQL